MELIFAFFKFFINILLIILKNPYLSITIILCIMLKLFYPKLRGYMGEFWVKKELNRLPKKNYIILNDIMIENSTGTHQIDHIIISNFGIFVIEMKNYYGLITGNDFNDKWTQYFWKKKYSFKNPLHQNYGHVKTLSELLNLEDTKFIPIVCFSNDAKLKIQSKNIVIQLNTLIETIQKFYKPLLSINLNEISNTIINNNIEDKEKRKKHIKNIKNKIIIDKFKSENMICPKCGNKLILKNSKYGTFVGCSNFPKCRYIKKDN